MQYLVTGYNPSVDVYGYTKCIIVNELKQNVKHRL